MVSGLNTEEGLAGGDSTFSCHMITTAKTHGAGLGWLRDDNKRNSKSRFQHRIPKFLMPGFVMQCGLVRQRRHQGN
ncbi:hypothetical protein CDEST_00695 [Colletotrichum destructivum]|uniref:Uncharacterized protein n=1 Tax=Colletotrichum destructivum TaxID=34406 RepID=A0AAX4HWZ0_9PEZI|nr:hypothetical protein CDEST_00695 [Colletotrichum destructivum]